jgi:hypothetical protein
MSSVGNPFRLELYRVCFMSYLTQLTSVMVGAYIIEWDNFSMSHGRALVIQG